MASVKCPKRAPKILFESLNFSMEMLFDAE
jgi:hypothetical protein